MCLYVLCSVLCCVSNTFGFILLCFCFIFILLYYFFFFVSIFNFFLFCVMCTQCCLTVSLDCPFLIAPSVFSNIYLLDCNINNNASVNVALWHHVSWSFYVQWFVERDDCFVDISRIVDDHFWNFPFPQ